MITLKTKLDFNDTEINNLQKLEFDSQISCEDEETLIYIIKSPARRQEVDFEKSYQNLMKNYKNKNDDAIVESPSYARFLIPKSKSVVKGILKTVNSTKSIRQKDAGASSLTSKVSFSKSVLEKEKVKHQKQLYQFKKGYSSLEMRRSPRISILSQDQIISFQKSNTLQQKWLNFVY